MSHPAGQATRTDPMHGARLGAEAISVRWVDGRAGVVILDSAQSELAALIDRCYAMHRVRTGIPIPCAERVVRALRHAAATNLLVERVPHGEQEIEAPRPTREGWVTTKQAGEVLGISPRAVRQRIGRGQLDATRHGRDYLVNLKHLQEQR